MCGVHNCTKHVEVRDLQSFAMIGTARRQLVIINMPIATEIPNYPEIIGNRTYIFTSVSNVRIINATIYFISISFRGENCIFEAKHVDYHGYIGSPSPMVSVIKIIGSEATLKDCTFQNNCFIRLQSQGTLTISDCIFHSYNHSVYSAIAVDNSTLKLSGNVSFINNTVSGYSSYSVCGGAILFSSGYSIDKNVPTSAFNILARADVSFINNSAASCGGALYLIFTAMRINSDANVTLTHNRVATSSVAAAAGAGGAMFVEQSTVTVKTGALLLITRNNAYCGGAIYLHESSIFLSGHNEVMFANNTALAEGGAIYMDMKNDISVDAHSNLIFHNNFASQGGAISLRTLGIMRIGSDSLINFSYNFAMIYGGAIYVDDQRCLFNFSDYSSKVLFKENSANESIGNHIYGASIISCMNSLCHKDVVSYTPNISSSLSPVSSSLMRACICDTNGKPQCAKLSNIFTMHKVYRGEVFNISVVLVGYDFGVTTGTVRAGFLQPRGFSLPSINSNQYHQLIDTSTHCSNITYNVYSKNAHEILYLYTSETNNYMDYDHLPDAISYIKDLIDRYNSMKHRCASVHLFRMPVFINITLLDGCPPGFTLTHLGQLHGCSCYPILQKNHFLCFITNNSGYFRWNSTMWVNATFNKYNKSKSDGILFARYCPLNFCRTDEKVINLGTDPNAQCDFNHAGTLCGGCENNYSLAIGSSHCIRCSSDLPLLMLIFLGAAGFLLVLLILLLDLTVTQGLINGLVFYANVLWTYKDTLFPPKQQQTMIAFQIFVAWLNLDFGIESCFIVGLTAFWKIWLQFLFPLYIWVIAGVIIFVCHYSSRLTNLIGDRAVPLLATLFLLSYAKLLRTLMTIFEFGVLTHYPNESKIIVWYLDGNLPYCQHPHIYLFLVAMAILIFLCIPFTFFLLLIQCWRRISYLRLQRWISKFIPFYDAYFAPLKDKHHYWFGMLLLARGALLIIFTATSSTSPLVGLLILAISLVMLLFYMSVKPVYKSKIVRLFESASLSNLLVLVTYTLYIGDKNSGTTALQISIGVAFVQFLLIILISAIKICYQNKCKCIQRKGYNQDSSDDDMVHERVNDPDINADMCYPIRNTVDTY